MKKRNRVLMIIGIVVGALILLAVGAGLYIESRAGEIIGREFTRMTRDRYRLTTGSVDISLFNRSVTLADISITPHPEAPADSTVSPVRIVDFSARELSIAGIHFDKRDDATNIRIRKLTLQAPKIKVEQIAESLKKSPRADTVKISPLRIAIGRIFVSEGYVEHHGIDTLRNVIEGFELQTGKLFIDTGRDLDASAIGDDMRMIIRKIIHMPEDESTRMEIDSLAFGTAARTLGIGSLAIVPTYSKAEFGYKSWNHRDWGRMNFSGISFHGIDIDRLLTDRELHIDSAHLTSGDVSSYKDRNIERVEWIKPMHYQLIQRLPVKFSLRTLSIGNIDAQYEELKAGGDKAGSITFDDIGGRIDGLGNISGPGREYSEWRMHARMMNAVPLTVTGYMPVDSLNDRFELAVSLGRTDATAFNGMITPLANIAVRSGTIDKIDMHIVGNTRRATIDMTFLYNDLEVAVLKEKDGHLEERGLLSGLVNHMVLIGRHPRHNETRKVHETVDRDPRRSPFNYLWRTVFAAAKETIGLGKL